MFTHLVSAAVVCLGAWSVNAVADVHKCAEAQRASAQSEAEKTSSGKWNVTDHVAVDAEHVKQLIAAHQRYGNGFTPLLPKSLPQ